MTATPTQRIELLIIDRPGVGAGCACSATDPALPALAGDLEWLRWQGVAGRRIHPRVTGKQLAGDAGAIAAAAAHGFEALPLSIVDGVVRHAGSCADCATLTGIVADARRAPPEPGDAAGHD